jgi:hypothetical protein
MSEPIVETVHPDDPSLAVKLKVLPPVVGKTYTGDPKHGDWTLDLVERTCLELRAAGAWDGSKVGFNGYPEAMTCEVLAGRGSEAMPWGWRPSEGPPKSEPKKTPLGDREIGDVIPAFLGHRVLHGVLLIALVVLAVIR